ncbi:MAG: NUDIX domain-containing protein [Demequinaceae bacterium]|nr:NUDIX domain-containing protein [Demequinaceae bacterium]
MAGSPPRSSEGGAQGVVRIERVGARVLLVDDQGDEHRLLMILGHDPHLPSRAFWFTPGGGLEASEVSREAAVRELAEETGYVLEPDELVGPVWRRTALFDFASLPYTQHEEFFVGRLADAERRIVGDRAFTPEELEAIDAVEWMTLTQLAADGREVFPARLLESWDVFLEWDGVTRDFGEVDE